MRSGNKFIIDEKPLIDMPQFLTPPILNDNIRIKKHQYSTTRFGYTKVANRSYRIGVGLDKSHSMVFSNKITAIGRTIIDNNNLISQSGNIQLANKGRKGFANCTNLIQTRDYNGNIQITHKALTKIDRYYRA